MLGFDPERWGRETGKSGLPQRVNAGFLRGVARFDIGVFFFLQTAVRIESVLNGIFIIAKNGSFHKSNNSVYFLWKYERSMMIGRAR